MRYLKSYKIFENVDYGLNPEQISFLDSITKEWEYDISTGLINVYGNFNCSSRDLKDFMGINFGTIDGNFICSNNKLESMEGMPKFIGGDFNCSSNKIKSLKGSPVLLEHKKILYSKVGSFDCEYNKLTSLEGIPDLYYYKLNVSSNEITSLEGGPRKVDNLTISFNPIESLEGPIEVRDFYNCSRIKATSLKGAPEKLDGSFFCSYNKQLKSLEGGPKEVYYYIANDCDLDNLKGHPEKVVSINLNGNKLLTLEELRGIEIRDTVEAEKNPVSEDFLRYTMTQEWAELNDDEREHFFTIQDMGLI